MYFTFHYLRLQSNARIVHQFVVPKLSSVDGTTSTGLYLKMIVPWMIQSPLMPNLTILVASFAQGLHQGLDANKCPETLAIKAKVLSLTNEFLARDFKEVGLDAILTVAHLASLEVSFPNSTDCLYPNYTQVHMGNRGSIDVSHARHERNATPARRLHRTE